MIKIRKIEIVFPVEIVMPKGFYRTLEALVDMACEKYESENPNRTMWPSGIGSKPIWREPEEPDFDDSIFQIEGRKYH